MMEKIKKIKQRGFIMNISQDVFSRYEVLKTQSNGGTGIVTEKFKHNGATKLTVRPYKVPTNKYLRFFKFLWLRIRLHYS